MTFTYANLVTARNLHMKGTAQQIGNFVEKVWGAAVAAELLTEGEVRATSNLLLLVDED